MPIEITTYAAKKVLTFYHRSFSAIDLSAKIKTNIKKNKKRIKKSYLQSRSA